ncbi:MAG: NifU family protein [Myxococcales bacterium]|nr:NifU family protein [Myxococcales bacterium]
MGSPVQSVIDEILGPLLERGGGHIEVVAVQGDEVRVRLSGKGAAGVGAEFIRAEIVVPALKAVLGDAVQVRFVDSLMPAEPDAEPRATGG